MSFPIINANRRILVVDDNRAIHADFRKILGRPGPEEEALQEAESELFGVQPPIFFDLDSASQGEEALRMVQQALIDGRPYAMAFIDVRMPPGWDGIETTQRIWEVCPDLQVVICTAFADCSWNEMQDQINPVDRLLILKKPFDTIEARQMAHALTEKWRLVQETKAMVRDLEHRVEARTRDLAESQANALTMMQEAILQRTLAEHACEELKREMAERKKVENQLLHAQRMESVGRLSSGIAHDMNNILSPLLLCVFMMRRNLPASEMDEMLNVIESSAKRGADIVNQLLAFSRNIAGQKAVVQPHLLVHGMMKIMKGTFPKTITLSVHAPEHVWPVVGDPTQLHQVLLNLCVNARDAMTKGGKLSLTAENVRLDENDRAVNFEVAPGPYVLVRVLDSGEGIPPEVIDKIFEPFFTTKTTGKGTGLGLSTVIGIVKSHCGFIKVRSHKGSGTTFEVYIPASPGAAAVPVDSNGLALRGDEEMILVVDDERPIRNLLQRTLVSHGYRVICAENGAEAIDLYAQHQGQISAVITDIMMPLMDGVTMVRKLRAVAPDLKILAVSGMGGAAERTATKHELAAMNVTTLLSKPYSADEILEAVGRLFTVPFPTTKVA